MIEIDVEMQEIPIDQKEKIGMDVVAHWKLYDGFNANRTFWTDANGLEM
jgi:hypothetical protein